MHHHAFDHTNTGIFRSLGFIFFIDLDNQMTLVIQLIINKVRVEL